MQLKILSEKFYANYAHYRESCRTEKKILNTKKKPKTICTLKTE